jgi:hypothetical protein
MMTRTFEEMCKARDPLYAAMQPAGEFKEALYLDKVSSMMFRPGRWLKMRDAALLALAIRALRNQGQPYYDRP